MGSQSDYETMKKCEEILQEFDIEFETKIVSAHRTPKRLYQFCENIKKDGIKLIIAGAGGAAHLPGMVASMTEIPVLGVPIKSKALDGLDAFFSDEGRKGVTGNINDLGKFKVPTLRNIEVSGPYMHDGRLKTLDEVIEHYSSGIIQSPTIDPLIEFASQGGVQLDAGQKDLLKKFLQTLTDYQFINNPAFRKP